MKRAFSEFIESNIKVRHVFTYGLGGAVYVISEKLVEIFINHSLL